MTHAPTETALVLSGVTKVYEAKGETPVTAVRDLSLTVRRGEIFSLVGPDGAGKTTAIRMMCGVLEPSSGSVAIFGMDMARQRNEIKKHIGYLSQRFSLYADLTVDENIDFFAEIHRVDDYRRRKEELLGFTRLAPFRSRLAGRLSGGMKQKLALACTLVHAPDIIFLDEPTTGVDPVSRRDFWKILSDLLRSGITIIVSTPYLDEAERSTRVALMNEGRILSCDTPEAIKAAFPYRVLEVVTEDLRRALEVVQGMLPRERIQLFGDRLHLLVSDPTAEQERVGKQLASAAVAVQGMRAIPPSLEDVFIASV